MISSDRNILSNSAVLDRMISIGKIIDELHIVILSDYRHKLQNRKISPNVWVYPTNSINRFLRPFDAIKIGRTIKADLITTQDPFECGWVGKKLKEDLLLPLEVQLHTDPFSPNFSGILNFIRKLIMKSVLKKVDSVRVVLNQVGDKLRELGIKSINLLPIYINRNRIDINSKFDLHDKYGFKTIILTVSRLTKEKNLHLAIRVFEKVVKKYPDAGFVIVGSGPERLKGKNVILTGWHEDLASFYKTADIYLQTSDYEGYGLSLIEAGLSGLPVVSTPVGIALELKNVVTAHDEKGLLDAVDKFLANKEERLRVGGMLKLELESVVLKKDEYLNKVIENWSKIINSKK